MGVLKARLGKLRNAGFPNGRGFARNITSGVLVHTVSLALFVLGFSGWYCGILSIGRHGNYNLSFRTIIYKHMHNMF